MEYTQDTLEKVTNTLYEDFKKDVNIQNDIKDKDFYKLKFDVTNSTLSYLTHEFKEMTVGQCMNICNDLLSKYDIKPKEEIEPATETFYTIQEVAEKLGYHHNTIRKAIKSGRLKAVKMAKEWRITETSLKDFLNN